jgi:hypothetical protein
MCMFILVGTMLTFVSRFQRCHCHLVLVPLCLLCCFCLHHGLPSGAAMHLSISRSLVTAAVAAPSLCCHNRGCLLARSWVHRSFFFFPLTYTKSLYPPTATTRWPMLSCSMRQDLLSSSFSVCCHAACPALNMF